jgi:VanZ family protein
MGQKQNLENLFIVYAVLIIVLAIIPLGDSKQLEKTIILHFRADHLLHMAIFIPWAFFCIKMKKYLILWFWGGILYAAFSEGIQCWIPYRSCNINDMLANVIGVVAGFFIFVPVLKLIKSNVE